MTYNNVTYNVFFITWKYILTIMFLKKSSVVL